MMKIFLSVLALLFLSCAATTTITKVDEPVIFRDYKLDRVIIPKRKIAITKFINATRFGQRRLGENISNVLATELSKTNRFILLERIQFDQILDEIRLSQSGLTQSSLEQMQLLGADFLIIGAVTQYSVNTVGSSNILTQSKTQRASVTADLRMVNVRTGEVIFSETGKGIAEKKLSKVLGMGQDGGYDESLEMDAFRAAVVKLTENIINSIDSYPWVCDVVKISGTNLYIDAGQQSNLNIGAKLYIYKRGSPIKDLSGRIIGYEENLLGSGEIIRFIGTDASILKSNISSIYGLPMICKLKGGY